MSITRTYFKFFLLDTPTGLCYYVDAMGNIQKGNIVTGVDYSLPQSPGGWDEMQLSFGRSTKYWGLNRTFSIALRFIGDGAKIVRSLFYAGRGIESMVTLVICKWDDVTGVFRLYYSGLLDLSKIEDTVAESVSVNIMEGGVVGMLKSFEDSMIEIQCDGSIPENIKVNDDGMLFTDTFHYSILPITSPFPGDQPLPCVFVSNDGDNIGITRNDPQLEQPYAGYYQKSSNFIFSSQVATTVKLSGTITIKSDPAINNTGFYMHTATSLSQPRGIGGTDHAIGLATPYVPAPGGFWQPINSQFNVNGQIVLSLNATIDLDENENLFIFFFNDFAANPVRILGGQFSLTFNSRYKPSRVWGMTLYDLGKLLIKRINDLSSNFLLTYNYGFDSNLLRSKLNLFVTSGDAARASTDPNYYQFYNLATLNPANPANQDYTEFSSLGPVIKTSISDYFESVNAILNACMSNQKLPGEEESIFIEAKQYVLDPSVITMSLHKISNFKVSIAIEYFWNWLDIGYEQQQYDEKPGKYEYNNQFHWQAPIKSIIKKLQIISKYRADPYGFEYTRYNTGRTGKSTTYNNSDNSVFVLNTDYSSFIYDFYTAKFLSTIPNPLSPTNTDQMLIPDQAFQAVYLDNLDGEYFTSNNDFSIFIFNQPIVSLLKSINVTFSCLLNGLEGDSATIKMYINGIVFQSWYAVVTGINTPMNAAFVSSALFNKGDNIYFTVSTVRTCTATINSFELNIGAGYFICDATGEIDVAAGETEQLIALPIITPTLLSGSGLPVVSWGMQYFRFLSAVGDTTFDWSFIVSGFTQGNTSESLTLNVWKNGVIIGTVTHSGTTAIAQFNAANGIDFGGTITFSLYDLIWVTASPTNLNTWASYLELTFTSGSIKAYDLYRPAYSNVAGIPNPETAFNISELTPGQMLRTNSSILSPALFNLAPGSITFQTADKNSFLSTTLDGVAITERANIDIHDLDAPLFYPLIFEFDTEVPINFADLFNSAANGHIEFLYNGKLFYGFPMQVTAKPALNESQTWKLLCSPKTNLSDLVDLDWDGLPILMPLDISIPITCPIHAVPLAYVKDSRYKNYTMDEDWYRNRIAAWIDQSDYYLPRQSNEPIPIQLQTSGLTPVTIQILNQQGENVGVPINIPSITDPAVNGQQILFQGLIDISTLADGIYYFLWSVGAGEGTGFFISEGVSVKQDWDYNTIRIDYSNSTNKLGTVFTSTPGFNIRVHGQINQYAPKSKFTTFVDQPQDIDLLNAIPYDTWKLEVGRGSGIPDYLVRKIARIFDLDTVFIDGDQYTRDAEAQWDRQTTPGQPKFYMSLDIRRAKNIDAITYNTAGQLSSDMPGGYTLDPTAFGGGAGQPLIQVGS